MPTDKPVANYDYDCLLTVLPNQDQQAKKKSQAKSLT